MIEGLNSSKKSVIIWMIVFVVLFVGLSVAIAVLEGAAPADEKSTPTQMLIGYVGAFLLSCLPIGWAGRRKLVKWYAHVPTEEIKVFETNLVVAIFRLTKCSFLLGLNLVLFAVYTAGAVIAGPILNFYTIISGIVFMCKKRI